MTPELGSQDLRKSVDLPVIKTISSVELYPGIVDNMSEIVIYEPREKLTLFPELDPDCFLLREETFGVGGSCRIYPSSGETLGKLLYSSSSFFLDVSYEKNKLVVFRVPASGPQGFGKLWVLVEKKLEVYRSLPTDGSRKVLETTNGLVLIPKLKACQGVILTTRKDFTHPEEWEILLNILSL